MTEKIYNSVLTFYAIKDDLILDTEINEVWDRIENLDSDVVWCTNVFHFEITPEELLSFIKNKDISSDLFVDIKSEYESGAAVMFISPIAGKPIAAFNIEKYIY